jgi:hypothetical protein
MDTLEETEEADEIDGAGDFDVIEEALDRNFLQSFR